MTYIINLLKTIISNRGLIFNLAKDDFKLRFAGARLGVIWGFIQPFVNVFLYWFVFQIGFHSGSIKGTPYILWLISGMVPWFFFNEAWNGGMNCMYEYSFLVKKVSFQIEILPIVKILSALFVHLFFIDLVFVFNASYGNYLTIYHLQLLYYLVCEIVLIYALSLITSSLAVFLKDTILFVGILLQIFFWTIPIVWSADNINHIILGILKINPLFYLVEGFRDTFVNRVWFWEKPLDTLWFWGCNLVLLKVGIVVYGKLKNYFADLL